ncbi:hypothetical protein CA948_01055 [Alcaligenes aquatilis]|nr:hypothetical protein CA948_01055 [Alcaligenes aquatilis]
MWEPDFIAKPPFSFLQTFWGGRGLASWVWAVLNQDSVESQGKPCARFEPACRTTQLDKADA